MKSVDPQVLKSSLFKIYLDIVSCFLVLILRTGNQYQDCK